MYSIVKYTTNAGESEGDGNVHFTFEFRLKIRM